MTEYIEYIFLENLIVSYITIYQVYLFTKMKAKKINIIIGSIILGFTLTKPVDASWRPNTSWDCLPIRTNTVT